MVKIKYLVWLFFIIMIIASSCKSDDQDQNKQHKYDDENGSELSRRENYYNHIHGDGKLSTIRKAKAVYGGSNDLVRRPKNSQSAPLIISSPKQLFLLGFLPCLIMFFPLI
ncbi:uncharacterized protein LOC115725594 [Cannabis sativa]|uniref:uncharacterized protein LOC115725594 n=1 Tax=Cannabis sativa TaxID=3483 RepID=UPI0011DFE078|nr:uncharacterized protein LOC115725594 [Cannabis sativa]